MFESSQKTADVGVPIDPKEDSRVIFRLIVEKLANVDITANELQPSTMSTAVLKLALIKTSRLIEADQQSISMLSFVAALSKVSPASTTTDLHLSVLHLLFGQFLQLRMWVVGKSIGMVLRFEELLDNCGLACKEMTIQEYFLLWLILRCGHGCIIGGRQFIKMLRLGLVLAVLAVGCALIFPPPVEEQWGQGKLTLKSACGLFQMPLGRDDVDSQYYLDKIAKRLNNQVSCGKQLLFQEEIHTKLEARVDSTLSQEGYELRIEENGVQLTFATYSGYVYGLETLAQLVGEGLKEGSLRVGIVRDEPQVAYRGIMVDSARHFLGIAALTRLVESMPLSKLNILHWHLVDDESFPIELGSHPELAKAANYGKGRTYTKDQVKELLRVAALNAVQVVPEIDTPAHVRSWGLAPEWKNKNITIKCAGGTGYNGQFDLSKPETFTLAADVVREVDELFRSSPYIHLGGDEVSSACWNLRPQIQNFMKLHNLKTYGELQMYWRFQLKQVLPAGRRAVFWRNDGANVSTSDDDVLHFWGAQADVAKITATSRSKIVLSPSDILYISKGMGNLWLNGTQGTYPVWRQIYEKFVLFPAGVEPTRILGAEVCLWGEVSNEDIMENNIWMRSSAFAARIWSSKTLLTHELVAGMVTIQRALNKMGVDASPFTSEFCEFKPEVCFPPGQSEKLEKERPAINSGIIITEA